MTILSVYPQTTPELPNKVLTHGEDIVSTLVEVAVRCAQWPTVAVADLSAETILVAYQAQIEQLTDETGLTTVDVLSSVAEPAGHAELRASLLQERHHAGDCVYLCVAGRGLLAMHIGEQVFELLAGKGDLLVLPAGIKHWLDLGEQAGFVAIRLFASAAAARPSVTGDAISERFARLDGWM
jgi:1,2-dihydroxy-3-keto-5-methylthiopentene dioxygenase